MGVLEEAEAKLKEKPLVTKERIQNDLTVLLAGAVGAWAVGASTGAVAAGKGILAGLVSGQGIKSALGAAVGVMGTATFINFISEEAMQTAGMACFVAKSTGDAVALRAALDNYTALYKEAKKQAALTTWATPFAKAAFDSNMMAVASAIDAYEAALGTMKKAAKEKREKAAAKSKVARAKTVAEQYEANALEAGNNGELALMQQWLDKIADAGARLKAQARVVKAATKTWKAAVAAALKAADAQEARRVLEFIPDAAVKATMQGKITDFETKVAVKAQKAAESAARGAVVKANKDAQEQQRAMYFASVLGGPDVPEATKARIAAQFGLTPPELSKWYQKALAGQASGSVSGASEMAQGSVYYGRSPTTGNYVYSVATARGLQETSSATTAASWAQAAGGKATAEGLVAGH